MHILLIRNIYEITMTGLRTSFDSQTVKQKSFDIRFHKISHRNTSQLQGQFFRFHDLILDVLLNTCTARTVSHATIYDSH